jgi:hypothetical protein
MSDWPLLAQAGCYTTEVPKHRVFIAVLVTTLGMCVSSNSAAQTSDEEAWGAFLHWLASAPPKDSPKALLDDYDKGLTAAGMSQAEVARRRSIIIRLMKTRDDGWKIIFNNIYANDKPGFRTQQSLASDTGSPGRRPVDLDPVALRRTFQQFRIIRLDDVIETPDWMNERVRLVRMLAQKPREAAW